MSDWRPVNAVAFVLVYVALSVVCCADRSTGQLLRNGYCGILVRSRLEGEGAALVAPRC